MADTPRGTFCVSYPVWFLVKGDTLDASGKLTESSQLITMQNDQGELSFPLFTDSDLASRYHEDSDELEDAVGIGSVETAETLAGILDGAKFLGIVSVVFDPPKSTGTMPRGWPLAYAAERIRNKLDL